MEPFRTGLPLIMKNADGNFTRVPVIDRVSKLFRDDKSGRLAKLNAVSFTESGVLQAIYSDGEKIDLTTIQLAAFENARHLKLEDKKAHIFTASKKVGEIGYGAPLTHPFGKILGRSLEKPASEKDLASCR